MPDLVDHDVDERVGVGRGVTASAELQLDWAVVKLDGQDRSTAFAEVLLGALCG